MKVFRQVNKVFDPKTDRFPYPEETDKHYLEIHMDRGYVFDTKYPYIDRQRGFLFRQENVRLILNAFLFSRAVISMGIRIECRE